MKTILKNAATAFAVTIGNMLGIVGGLCIISDVHDMIKEWKGKREKEKEKEESEEESCEDEELDFGI